MSAWLTVYLCKVNQHHSIPTLTETGIKIFQARIAILGSYYFWKTWKLLIKNTECLGFTNRDSKILNCIIYLEL